MIYRTEIQVDKAYTFRRAYFDKGVQQVPTHGTDNSYAIVYDNAGGTAQSATQLDIDSNGNMSFTFTASNNDDTAYNFKIEWVFVIGTDTIYEYELFDVVEHPIANVTRDEDLFKYLPSLRDDVKELYGETTSTGSTSTMVSTRLAADQRDWQGGFVEIYVGDTTVHTARITEYASATSTVTFTPVYSISIASGLKFRIRTSYQDYIDEAFEKHVWRDLRNRGKVASGYIDGNVVLALTVYKTIELISFGKREQPDDTWDLRYREAKNEYNTQLQKFYEPFDTDADGNIESEENNERPNFSNVDMHR